MKGYVSVYRIADGQILANISKFRIYARLQGFISEAIFNNGQSALDATFALMASLNPRHIDYILDMRFSDPWPNDILKLWKKKALEILSKYPQVQAVGVTQKDSPLWLQIYEWKEFFEKYGDRILGTLETPEKAEAFLDKLRNFKS
jgi:retron-type reverse transcriptase